MTMDGDNAGGSKEGKGPFPSTASVFKQISETFKEIAPWYETLGTGGFLVVSGMVIAFATVGLSFLSGIGDVRERSVGINLEEEILFLAIAAIFSGLGVFSVHKKNSQISGEKLRLLELQIEKNKFDQNWEVEKIERLHRLAEKKPELAAKIDKQLDEIIDLKSGWHD